MKERIDRRRFVTAAWTAGIIGVAGCIGGGEETPEGNGNGNGGSEPDQTGDDGAEGDDTENGETENDEQSVEFDFPPGANERGVVMETLIAGARQFVAEKGRYRATQTHVLNYSDSPRENVESVYDVDESAVRERHVRGDVEIDRWVTPDRTVGRSADTRNGRGGRWLADTPDPIPSSNGTFTNYPFEETTVPSLLESASFEFDEIVTESERSYARYSGDISGSERLELPQRKSARLDYRLESVSEGRVSMLLAESGAVRSVEYEFTGEASRLTREGREAVGIETDGDVRFEYHDLEALTMPGWAETTGSNDIREFEIAETSLGQTYKLVSGPTLPGSVELEYAEFYLTAQFDGENYIDRYTPRTEFDDREGVVAGFDGELELDWASMSGRDALKEAERIEMSVYLYAPGEGRTIVYHEEFYP